MIVLTFRLLPRWMFHLPLHPHPRDIAKEPPRWSMAGRRACILHQIRAHRSSPFRKKVTPIMSRNGSMELADTTKTTNVNEPNNFQTQSGLPHVRSPRSKSQVQAQHCKTYVEKRQEGTPRHLERLRTGTVLVRDILKCRGHINTSKTTQTEGGNLHSPLNLIQESLAPRDTNPKTSATTPKSKRTWITNIPPAPPHSNTFTKAIDPHQPNLLENRRCTSLRPDRTRCMTSLRSRCRRHHHLRGLPLPQPHIDVERSFSTDLEGQDRLRPITF